MKRINSLTIAGTDPSGGAGIQADLKTFSALGSYGTSVITALIAQNTNGVKYIYNIKPYFIDMQLDSVLNDIRIDSLKIGMLSQSSIVDIVAQKIKKNNIPFIVLDPVIFSKNGYRLLSKNAVNDICIKLFPYVSIITPNIFESAFLLKTNIAKNDKEILIQGKLLLNFGCKAVLIKGGHIKSNISKDWLFTKSEIKSFSLPRVKTLNTHGTGCSLSSALAALRPRHENWIKTISVAKNWIQKALEQADTLEVGKGFGPIHHFHQWW